MNFRNVILTGDVRAMLRTLPDKCVHCITTSPPYWGLRSYGTVSQVWGGVETCRHEFEIETGGKIITGGIGTWDVGYGADDRQHFKANGKFCKHCGAWLGELGCEPNPKLFVEHIVEIYREAWRVLRDDGVLYMNLGDSYTGNTINRNKVQGSNDFNNGRTSRIETDIPGKKIPEGLKPKDLVGIPWKCAFALQADGWYLRSDIIWDKPNPMPESVVDRPTKSHEYIFLLTKSENYFWDAEAVKEPISDSLKNDKRFLTGASTNNIKIGYAEHKAQNPKSVHRMFNGDVPLKRNIRSVWRVPTQAFAGAHFATFPEKIAETCIKSGTSEYGCCSSCGTPWERVIKKNLVPTSKAVVNNVIDARDLFADANDQGSNRQKDGHKPGYVNDNITLGWRPTCSCGDTVIGKQISKRAMKVRWYLDRWQFKVLQKFPAVVPCVVLDTFAGSGTTLEVAKRLGRDYVGIELSEKYVKDILDPRMENVMPLFSKII